MIKYNTPFINLLRLAFPNAKATRVFEGASYLFDTGKRMIGHFDWDGECFYLNEDYEYLKEAEGVLEENGVNYKLKEYEEGELLYK